MTAFWHIQTTLPAVVTVLAFTLFYVYLTKLRLVIASRGSLVSEADSLVLDESNESPEPAEST